MRLWPATAGALRWVCGLYALWTAAWAAAQLVRPPECVSGGACSTEDRRASRVPWHGARALEFYLGAFAASHCAAWAHVCAARPGCAQGALECALRSLGTNALFWTPLVLALTRTPEPRDDAGAAPALAADDPRVVFVVGNGPIAPRHHQARRGVDAARLYRFNGMSTLLSDEEVGTVFARAVTDDEFWGVAPPLSALGVLERLLVPGSRVLHARYMCARLREARSLVLVGQNVSDAVTTRYRRLYDLPVAAYRLDAAQLAWSTGFLGVLHVLRAEPAACVHVLGMGRHADPEPQDDAAQRRHPLRAEAAALRYLADAGRVVLHQPPSSAYRAQRVSRSRVFRDVRVEGLSCDEWTPYWLPLPQLNPRWVRVAGLDLPVPPFFSPAPAAHERHEASALALAQAALAGGGATCRSA